MEQIITHIANEIRNKYYGKYRGFVIDNEDPQQRGRVTVRIPSVLGDAVSGWALPCVPYGGLADQGFFMIPENGAQVWVEFEEGDISKPLWVGTFWQQNSDTPVEAAKQKPTTRLIKTGKGHLLQFDDEDDAERFILQHPKGSTVEIDKNGSIALTDAGGAVIKLDADANTITIEDHNGNEIKMDSSGTLIKDSNGNKIEMAGSGITVKGQQIVVEGTQVMLGGHGGEPIIKGQSFLSLFMTHMHPTGVGPSGPPIPQGEMSTLSAKVTSS
ncbi:MAG: phage baseplate assembly protein V [Gammaproteobacteria bacterium]|nr:phage baseplate assembly protein V [Gammaproteobacteria bacterium]